MEAARYNQLRSRYLRVLSFETQWKLSTVIT
uniref:Uncharacterized protein n=1 Tax=Arundo donax TaxID=35708 RepID=A0A0A9H9H3_ARUDO